MTKYFLCVAISLLAAVACAAQAVVPIAKPTPPTENEVVKISTNLVQVDVSVTDKSGKIVRDLRSDEIEIYQNGKKQDISNFTFISNTREVIAGQNAKAQPQPGVPVPPTPVRVENVKRTIALVVDDLTLSFESTYYVRRALKKFVDEQMQDGDLVAIIRTGAGIGALQQFTTDKRQLYAAIEKVRWNPAGNGNIGAFAPLEAKLPNPVPTPTPQPGDRTDEGREREFNDFRAGVFATGSLGAINYVVRGMAELPGRKSIMLLSDGFKLFTKDAEGFTDSGMVLDAVRNLVDKANRASVVIYTMDARGLVYTGLSAADNTSGRSMDELRTAESDRRDELLDTQDGLRFLAEQTGGFAVVNNNDLSGGIRRLLDDQSYYLLGYIPDDETFDPKTHRYNKLTVKILRKGVNVRYRSGFFNVEEKAPEKTSAASTPFAELENALVSPFAVSGINLKLNALYGSDAAGNSYVRSLLHISGSDLKFTDEADGTKKAVFEILAVSFGDNGQAIDQIAKSYTLAAKPETYKKVIDAGFIYNFTFPVKKPGPYQYRVAIRDAQGGKLGSASQFIEVPDLRKNRLTVSSIVIEILSPDQWGKMVDATTPSLPTDPMTDTTLRRVKPGSVLRYGFEIYNAKLGTSKQPDIQTKVRVFRDGKLMLDGKQIPLELGAQTNLRLLRSAGAVSIGTKMAPGDYVLQIIVTDNLAKPKEQVTSQFVQFEVVE